MEETNDFYPHRRDDNAITNLPQNNPTYPTREELDGLLQNVENLTDEARKHAEACEQARQQVNKQAQDAYVSAGESKGSASEAKNYMMSAQTNYNLTVSALSNARAARDEAESSARSATESQFFAEIAMESAEEKATQASGYANEARILAMGGKVAGVQQDGAKQFCERSEEACTDAVAAAAQTAADLEDVRAYHDLVEENLGLVPAVAVDTAAVRDASRVLVGTDNAALTDLMGAL